MKDNRSEKAKENSQINYDIHERIRKWLEEHESLDKRAPETRIAERLDCDYVTYQKQISVGKAITLQELISYAEMLGCSTDYLLGISPTTKRNNTPTEFEDFIKTALYYDAFCDRSSELFTCIDVKEMGEPEHALYMQTPIISFSWHTSAYFNSLGATGDLGDLFWKYKLMKAAFEYLTEEQTRTLINNLVNDYFHPLDSISDFLSF